MKLHHPSGPELISQNQSHSYTPCFKWDEKEVRAGTSSFLNTPSFDLGQGGVLPPTPTPGELLPYNPSQVPTTLITLTLSALAHLKAICML